MHCVELRRCRQSTEIGWPYIASFVKTVAARLAVQWLLVGEIDKFIEAESLLAALSGTNRVYQSQIGSSRRR